MWIAGGWKDYEVLDTSDGEKLERWGDYRLIRPDPQVIWKTSKASLWHDVNGHYHRSSKGGGDWEFHQLPQEWMIHYGLGEQKCRSDLHFMLKPFSFKHTGLFPEQAVNWEWFYPIIRNAVSHCNDSRQRGGLNENDTNITEKDAHRSVKVLNLFAYTGGATIAAAAAGATVTHVDASKGMVTWAKENAALSGLEKATIRWLVDDCTKFVEREIRRGNHYDAIILDPPSYGRGPKGEIWKMEDNIYDFLKLVAQLLSAQPLFVLLNSYTTGLQPAVLTYLLHETLDPYHKGAVLSDEIGLPVTSSGLVLPEGASGRWLPV